MSAILVVYVRITPAHAGKSPARLPQQATKRHHPRTRGEKSPRREEIMVGEGSPPHTRGKDGISEPLYHCCGITPAHAGKRNLDSGVPVPGGDHPRTRGEKHEFFDDDPEHTGSPPHTRGKGTAAHDIKGMFRITPAHAGKRTYRIICSPLRADHPRTRGEKEPDMKISGCQQGSPPHTRGKASRNAVVLMGDGITPAHAGKRRTKTGVLSSARDHPRTRGEKIF